MTRKKIPIISIVVSLATLGGIAFAARFVVGGFLQERVLYSSLRTQIDDIQYKRGQLTLAQTSVRSVDSDVAHVEKSFVDQNDILNALVPLEQEAASAGIGEYKVTVAQDISSSEGQVSEGKKSPLLLSGTTLRIEGRGTLEMLFAFVRTLQALPYFLRIESLQLQQTGLSTGASAVTAPLQATIIVKFFNLP